MLLCAFLKIYIMIYLAQFNLVFFPVVFVNICMKKKLSSLKKKIYLLLPWKTLPTNLSISPWRCCTHQCICKQVGTLWRQTQYHTICGPPFPPLSSLSIPYFKAERLRWRFGKKWKTNCSFVSGRRPDTWANSLCTLSALQQSYVQVFSRWARKRGGPSNYC